MLKESTLMRAFRFTMQEEGGETYTNDPRDPGRDDALMPHTGGDGGHTDHGGGE